jgi:hypothetical protein
VRAVIAATFSIKANEGRIITAVDTEFKSISLFFALSAVEPTTRVRIYSMYRTTIFHCQEPAGAICSASRYKRTNTDQSASGVNNRAGTGKEMVEREPHQIGLTQVLRNPVNVCRNQPPGTK